MIRILDAYDVVTDQVKYFEFAGLSTDTPKPTDSNISTGSVFTEVDTGDVYLYDEVSATWNKVGE